MESTKPFEPIPIYHEGKLDRRYWYTLQAKRHLSKHLKQLGHQIDTLFEEHRLDLTSR